MKKTSVVFILSIIFLSNAVVGQEKNELVKKIAVGNFSTLVVRNSVTIQLSQDDTNDSISIEGDKSYLNDVKVFQIGKTLIVSGKQRHLKRRGTIHIPVRSLQSLQVNASATIISYNVLQSPVLNLVINGTCTVDIVLNGKLNVLEGEGYDFTYTRVYDKGPATVVKN